MFCLIIKCHYRYLCREDNWDEQFQFKYRGPVTMKGKSEPMDVWFLSRTASQQRNEAVTDN